MVTVGELLESGTGAALAPAAGRGRARSRPGASRSPRLQQPGLALAGFLPQLHPDRVQVLGNSEIGYLAHARRERGARRAVDAVAQARRRVLRRDQRHARRRRSLDATADARRACRCSPPRCARPTSSAPPPPGSRSASRPRRTLHGVLVEVHGLGVLILGQQRHRQERGGARPGRRAGTVSWPTTWSLVAAHLADGAARARGASCCAHHMEIRGLGVIDVEALFGTLATLDERQIDLVVELIEWTETTPTGSGSTRRRYMLLDVALPLVRIPVTRRAGASALLIEIAARNQLLRWRGRHSAARVRGAHRPRDAAGGGRAGTRGAMTRAAARGRRHRPLGVGQEHRDARARGPRASTASTTCRWR